MDSGRSGYGDQTGLPVSVLLLALKVSCPGKPRHTRPTPVLLGFPCGSAGKESVCNAGELGLIPWVGKIPWRRERLPALVLWPGEFHGLYSPWGHKESDTTERISLSL